MTGARPLLLLPHPRFPITPTPQPSLSESQGPYLCLDHASSLVSQVLQGSGNINLFSTCNRPKIGLSSKQRSNPAHICQSLFIPGSLWNSAAIENYYIHPSKDLDESHRLFPDKICRRIFWGSAERASKTYLKHAERRRLCENLVQKIDLDYVRLSSLLRAVWYNNIWVRESENQQILIKMIYSLCGSHTAD